MRRRIWLAVALAVQVCFAAACSDPVVTSSPTTSDVPVSPAPSGDASVPSSALPSSDEPLATPAPTPPGSTAMIVADLEAGAIDAPTATLYRVFALFGDDRLPEKYQTSEAIEDDAALDTAQDEIDSYPADIQAQLRPFLLRPTDPSSYWAVDAPAATADAASMHEGVDGGRVELGSAISPRPAVTRGPASRKSFAAVSACVNGWITRAAATSRVIVWGACGFWIPEADAMARVTEVVTYVDAVYGPMTALMGPLIGDATFAGDTTEANDGKLDIYVVDYAVHRHARDLDSQAHRGVCYKATPYRGAANAFATSSYIVIDGPRTGLGLNLKGVITHELFHSLEAAHNRTGTEVAPDFFWMVEASALWAEHQFAPDVRFEPYYWFDQFRDSPRSLSDQADFNPYKSWMWPLFIAQEKGPQGVAAIWRAMEGKSGFTALQDATDNQLPFQNRFRDFAVRVWNENLQQGDPIDPRFQAWDSAFPLRRPAGRPRWHYNDTHVSAQTQGDPPIEVAEQLPSLWASYSTFKLERDVGQLVVDFSGLSPATALDVDALVKIKDKGWERRKLPPGMTRFCRDNDADNVEELIIVLSDHDKARSASVTGKWTYQGLAQFCADLSGTLTIRRDGVYHEAQGEPAWTRSEHLTATVFVGMAADTDPLGGGGYIDTESSFQISRTTLEARQMGDCATSYGTKTNGSWEFINQPVGPDWENSITGFVNYDLGVVVLAVVVHYPYEVTEVVDCGMGVYVQEHAVHDLFSCKDSGGLFGGALTGKITEVADGPDTVTFSCHEQGPAMDFTEQTISITGTLTLADE